MHIADRIYFEARIFAILQTLYAASVEYITRSYYVSLEIDRSQDDIYFRILEFVFEEQMKDLHKRLRRAQGVSKVQNSQQTIYRPYNDSAPPRPENSFMPSKCPSFSSDISDPLTR